MSCYCLRQRMAGSQTGSGWAEERTGWPQEKERCELWNYCILWDWYR